MVSFPNMIYIMEHYIGIHYNTWSEIDRKKRNILRVCLKFAYIFSHSRRSEERGAAEKEDQNGSTSRKYKSQIVTKNSPFVHAQKWSIVR